MKFKPWLIIVFISLYSPISSAETNPITETWLNLAQTENQCPELYDYFPNGGMLSFYCHAKTFLNVQDLQKLAAMPIFISGPHQNNQLDLQVANDFAHYNPEFVLWLVDHMIPAAKDEDLQRLTQPLYDQYVKTLARTYYRTYQALQNQPDYLRSETEQYANLVENHNLPMYHYEKYYDFAGLHEIGYDGNVVKGAVAFWIRRSIDNTIGEFFLGLEKLLNTYDVAFLQKEKPSTSPKTLTDVWLNLENFYQNTDINCESEQTWLPEYGMRGFYCHIKNGFNFAQLQSLVDMPIFLSGPHQNQQLDLTARYSFGHYNPAFIHWLGNNIIPENPSPEFLQTTQAFYIAYIQSLARTYYLVYRILQLNPDYKEAEKQRYAQLIQSQELPEFYSTSNYFDMQSNYAELAQYAEIEFTVASAMTFWLRRLMDGTAGDFILVLKKLLKTYDVGFLNQFPLPEEIEKTVK